MMRSVSQLALALLGALALAGCEFPPMESVQTGYRGTGQAQVYNPDLLGYLQEANVVPAPPYPLEINDTTPVSELGIYQNVQVLGDVSAEEFNHLMAAITEWIVPQEVRDRGEGCAYCHNVANMASDEVYTKVVSRRMIQMTRAINTQWQSHVGATGVSCYTCHRGQPVPANVWALQPAQPKQLAGNDRGQNRPVESVAYATLPYDPFGPYLGENPLRIRQQSQTALPYGSGPSIRETEMNYGLMMHMSDALGVNCTYCHNSRSFAVWDQSHPARITAWYGIRMVRDINNFYIQPLAAAGVFPAVGYDNAARLGPLGDALKTNCTTCHQGVNRPLYGVSMVPDHPWLARPGYEGVVRQTLDETEDGMIIEASASGPAVTP